MEKPYSDLEENLKEVFFKINDAVARYGRDPASVRLMAVTKTVPAAVVNEVIKLGVSLLGENKAQELALKYNDYERTGAEIHFIGHLQRNKARQVVDKVSMIQSVDRMSLAQEIDSQALKLGKTMPVLLEVNIGGEAGKSGVAPEMLLELVYGVSQLKHIKALGLMTIPPFDINTKETEEFFSKTRRLMVDIKAKNVDNISMEILSMGMSGDYVEAIKHGANIVRVGSAIFGARV